MRVMQYDLGINLCSVFPLKDLYGLLRDLMPFGVWCRLVALCWGFRQSYRYAKCKWVPNSQVYRPLAQLAVHRVSDSRDVDEPTLQLVLFCRKCYYPIGNN